MEGNDAALDGHQRSLFEPRADRRVVPHGAVRAGVGRATRPERLPGAAQVARPAPLGAAIDHRLARLLRAPGDAAALEPPGPVVRLRWPRPGHCVGEGKSRPPGRGRAWTAEPPELLLRDGLL